MAGIGREVSRSEALQIAQQILQKAEQGRIDMRRCAKCGKSWDGVRPTCQCPGLDGDAPWPDLDMHPDGAANWPWVVDDV